MNLYLKTIDPNYKPIVDTYNETIDKLNKYIQCPFDEKTCIACKDVVEWNDINQVLSASSNCKKAISSFCKQNTSHSFCKCWNTESPEYNSTNCKVLRSLFENDKMTCLTNNEILNMTKQCNKQADETGLNFQSDYTFDKVRVKYDDSLTTQERIQLGKDVSPPDFMSVRDYQADLAKSAIRIADNKNKTKPMETKVDVQDVDTLTEDELLMKEIIKTEEDIKLNKKTDGGLWSILRIFT